MAKSVEQKLFEAFTKGRGVRLSADDVWNLIGPDDSIGSRISNVAAEEAGVGRGGWPGHDGVPRNGQGMSWAQFKRHLTTHPTERK